MVAYWQQIRALAKEAVNEVAQFAYGFTPGGATRDEWTGNVGRHRRQEEPGADSRRCGISDDVSYDLGWPGSAYQTHTPRLHGEGRVAEKQIDIIIDAANQYRIFSNMAIWRAVQAKADSRTSSGTLIEETFRPRWKIIQGDLDGHLADILLALEIDLGQTDYQKLLAFIRTKVKAEIEYGAGEGR